jgi:hypothetical protein
VPSPELRCLECNRQFADLTADQDVERCAECGKFVVSASQSAAGASAAPVDLTADVVADENVPTVGRAKPSVDLPLAQPVKPSAPPPMSTMPAWARRDGDDAPAPAKPADSMRPTFPPRPPTESRSYTELPSQTTADRKQKVGFALFIAFLFLLAMIGAVGVLGYTIIRGLQMKKVLTEAAPTGQVVAFSRASDS